VSAAAVIGLGRMGSRIAQRLLLAGHEVAVWNRSPERMLAHVDVGAVAVETPAAAAAGAEVLITCVADPPALRQVTEGPEGVAAGAHDALTVVEMSTVGPGGIDRLAATLPPETGVLDAPVLGGIAEAEAGSLTIFVGGTAELVEQTRPLLSALGSVVHVGPLGAGAAAKLVANATLFGTLATLGEALALAETLGLSEEVAHAVLAVTPLAGQAERRRAAIEEGRYPPRFRLDLARKDADLISEAAAGADLRVTEATRSWIVDAQAGGWGEHDYTAMLARILARDRPRGRAISQVDYDGLVVDLDGVIWLRGEPIQGAPEAIARVRARGAQVVFLTNDPESSRDDYAERLTEIGIPATADDVVTSAAATARFIGSREHLAGRPVFVVGSSALQEELADAGFPLVPARAAVRAEVVVVGGHPGFDYDELAAAATAVRAGAKLFATGRDAVYPTRDGPRPATGAILAAVETAAGATATVIGKPEPFVFEIARERLTDCERVAVVGDHLISDVAGAKRGGLDAILVLTGASTRGDLDRAPVKPDLVLTSVAELQ
jgi:HAD superfamily hydrolase (TIGR01450 family)